MTTSYKIKEDVMEKIDHSIGKEYLGTVFHKIEGTKYAKVDGRNFCSREIMLRFWLYYNIFLYISLLFLFRGK